MYSIEEIKEAIKKIGSGDYLDGSSVNPGYSYHTIPLKGFEDIPKLIVFNKRDNTDQETIDFLENSYHTQLISALNKTNIQFIRELLDIEIQKIFQFPEEELNYQYSA